MGYTKTIICLAISKKWRGKCVAGVEYAKGKFGEWVRPVSSREGKQILEEDRRYEDGTLPKLLDIVRISFLCREPVDCQQENHILDTKYYWEKKGSVTPQDLLPLCDNSSPLWADNDSSYNGMNDQIQTISAVGIKTSLRLVGPVSPVLNVGLEPYGRKVRAEFLLGKTRYRLAVTHPRWEKEYLAKEDGTYKLNDQYLMCISLGGAFRGRHYKLVASAIVL